MDTVVLIQNLELIYKDFGYPITFIGSFLEATPIAWALPGGVFVAAGGFYAYDKTVSLVGIIIAGFLGEWISLMVGYAMGEKKVILKKRLGQEGVAKHADSLWHKQGPVILTTSMLSGLTRFWVAYFAGFHKYSKRKFLLYSAFASFTWTAVTVVIGYLAGSERLNIEKGLQTIGIVGWVIPIIVISTLIYKIRKDYLDLKKPEKIQ